MKKGSQQSRSWWWIWSRDAAKGLLMRYLLLHQKARRKPSHESQFLLSSRTEQHHRIRRPVENAYSSNYSEWNVDKTWSSQEWKSDELVEVGTGAKHTDKFIVENDKNGFLHRSRIRCVVKIQIILAQGEWSSATEAVPIFKRCNERQRQTLCDMENVYVFYISSICIRGEELLALTSSSSPSDVSACPISICWAPPLASCPASFSPTYADTRFLSSS